jgi:GR25 family glycosyltransferase involved in LPS biosynthesis
METMFDQYKLNYERINAIDGRKLQKIDDRLNPYEQACTLSHLKAIQIFYDSGEEQGIICEDDLSLEFLPYWKKSLNQVIHEAPKDWQIILLGYIVWPKYHVFLQLPYNPFQILAHNSTLCYVINRKGAEKILKSHSHSTPNLSLYTKIRPVADVLIYDLVKTYVYEYSLFTYPDHNTSTIHLNHSDFHSVSKLAAKLKFTNQKFQFTEEHQEVIQDDFDKYLNL